MDVSPHNDSKKDNDKSLFIELSLKLKKLGDSESSTVFVNLPRGDIPVILEGEFNVVNSSL